MFKAIGSRLIQVLFTFLALSFWKVNSAEVANNFVISGPNSSESCSSLKDNNVLENDYFLVIEANTIRGLEWQCQLTKAGTWSWKKDFIHQVQCAQEGHEFHGWLSFYRTSDSLYFFFSDVDKKDALRSGYKELISCSSLNLGFKGRIIDIYEGDYSCDIEIVNSGNLIQNWNSNFDLCSNLDAGYQYEFKTGIISIYDCDGQLPCNDLKYIPGLTSGHLLK